MSIEPSLWSFISHSGIIVKIVLLILLLASIASWAIIIQRALWFKQIKNAAKSFNERFWSGSDLGQLYERADGQESLTATHHIFHAGFKEFKKLNQQGVKPDAIMQGTERAMRIAEAYEMEALEKHLPFLATVGSTSPYVGLFGTVWGIMSAFRALGTVQQASVAMVAPGIAEALIATAIGLFAAIPAVIAYNRFSSQLERIGNQYATFQEELSGILHREVYSETRQVS